MRVDLVGLTPVLHMSMKKMTLSVRYWKDHIISRPKMMITGASFEKNGVKEWVAIVVTNYGREPNVNGMGIPHTNLMVSWAKMPCCPRTRHKNIHISSMLQCIACSCSPHNVLHSPSFTVRYSTHISSFLALDSPDANVPSFNLLASKDFIIFIISVCACISRPLIVVMVSSLSSCKTDRFRINTATCGLGNK